MTNSGVNSKYSATAIDLAVIFDIIDCITQSAQRKQLLPAPNVDISGPQAIGTYQAFFDTISHTIRQPAHTTIE